MNKHTKSEQFKGLQALKWVLTAIALIFLYYEIVVRRNAPQLFDEYRDQLISHRKELLYVVLLMPVNWIIDALKWRWLLGKYTRISLWNAIRGVLMGISVGLFTPNGVGEFAGRMLVVPLRKRQYAVSASIVGSLAQLAITITIGGACIVYFLSEYVTSEYTLISQIAAVLTVAIGFVAYFKLPNIARIVFQRIPRIKRFRDFVQSMTDYSPRALLVAYGLGTLRYLVFCTQLGILLFTIGDISIMEQPGLLFLIPVYYYIQTLIPTVALSEIGVRGLILAYLFDGVLLESDVILASFIIWVVNLILPGVVGLFVAWGVKFKNK